MPPRRRARHAAVDADAPLDRPARLAATQRAEHRRLPRAARAEKAPQSRPQLAAARLQQRAPPQPVAEPLPAQAACAVGVARRVRLRVAFEEQRRVRADSSAGRRLDAPARPSPPPLRRRLAHGRGGASHGRHAHRTDKRRRWRRARVERRGA
eukprot:4397371-Prymnesium_polylepis.1